MRSEARQRGEVRNSFLISSRGRSVASSLGCNRGRVAEPATTKFLKRQACVKMRQAAICKFHDKKQCREEDDRGEIYRPKAQRQPA